MIEIAQQSDLIRRCIRGESKAQYDLYRLYSKAMYNICVRMLGNKMDAEDVLQTSFINVYRSIKNYRGDASIGSWIKRIVINNCLNHIKKNKVILEDISDNEYRIVDEKEAAIKYDISAVQNAIMKLPEGYRTVLNLYLMEGYSHEEIGQILNVSVSTSKSQFSRAKTKLKEIIKSRENLKIEL